MFDFHYNETLAIMSNITVGAVSILDTFKPAFKYT